MMKRTALEGEKMHPSERTAGPLPATSAKVAVKKKMLLIPVIAALLLLASSFMPIVPKDTNNTDNLGTYSTEGYGYYEVEPKGPENFLGWIPVSTYEDLKKVGTGHNDGTYVWSLNAKYFLTNDIDCTDEFPLDPIGKATLDTSDGYPYAFTGIFDGNGYSINGLTVNALTGITPTLPTLSAGLFGTAVGATISNLIVYGKVSIDVPLVYGPGNTYVGGIAGHFIGGTIENCHFIGDITVTNDYNRDANVGGVIGGTNNPYNINIPSSVTHSQFTGTVTVSSSKGYAGGIIGVNDLSQVIRCLNEGDIEVKSAFGYAGGITGSSRNAKISECYNVGQVTVTSDEAYAGGITGKSWVSAGPITIIEDCINRGDVSAKALDEGYAGGIMADGAETEVTRCSNYGKISAGIADKTNILTDEAYAGGIVGNADMVDKIINCTNHGAVTANGNAIAIAGGITGFLWDEFKMRFITIEDCANDGSVTANGGSLVCAGGTVGMMIGTAKMVLCSNSGPVSAVSTGTYAEKIYYYYAGASAGGIAGYTFGLAEMAECENKGTISATAEGSLAVAGGMVGIADTGTIKDLHMIGPDFYSLIDGCKNLPVSFPETNSVKASSMSDAYAGGIVGFSIGTTVADCENYVDVHTKAGSVYNYSYKTGIYAYSGGIAGLIKSADIADCKNTGDLYADADIGPVVAGGIAGAAYSVRITDSVNNGKISLSGEANWYVAGGIIGYAEETETERCTNRGSISSAVHAGGIIGFLEGGSIIDCVNEDAVSVDGRFSYAAGIVSFTVGTVFIYGSENRGAVTAIGTDGGSCAGGIVGEQWASDVITITHCTNKGAVTAKGTKNAFAGGILGSRETVFIAVMSEISYCSNSGDVSAIEEEGGHYGALAGGIVGWAPITMITQCENSGAVTAKGEGIARAGGMGGYIDNDVSYCVNSGDVSAEGAYAYAGGMIGYSGFGLISVKITNCGNSGNVSVKGTNEAWAGGMVAYISATSGALYEIFDCINSGNVSAEGAYEACAGGTVGYALVWPSSLLEVSDCTNSGNVSAEGAYKACAGGTVGYIEAIGDDRSKTAEIMRCGNSGDVNAEGEYAYAGGAVGYIDGRGIVGIAHGKNSGTVSTEGTNTRTGGMVGFAGVREATVKITDCENSGNVSGKGTNESRAGGIAGCVDAVKGSSEISHCVNSGDVSAEGPGAYAGGAVGHMKVEEGEIKATNCENTGNVSSERAGKVYVGGIAGSALAMKGALLEISGCTNSGNVSAKGEQIRIGGIAGVTGTTDKALLDVSDCTNSGDVSAEGGYIYAGGMVGHVDLWDATVVRITRCGNSGNVTAEGEDANAGGIAGFIRFYDATAETAYCRNSGKVSAEGVSKAYAGGIAGAFAVDLNGLQSIMIFGSSYNEGGVSASATPSGVAFAGGILGAGDQNMIAKVTDCYNAGPVTADGDAAYAGGIAGSIPKGNVSNCHSVGLVTGTAAGGVAGWAENITITNCYYLSGSVNGSDDHDKFIISKGYALIDGGEIRKTGMSGAMTEKDMRYSGSYYQKSTEVNGVDIDGWDFEKVWMINPFGHPMLRALLDTCECGKCDGSCDCLVCPSCSGCVPGTCDCFECMKCLGCECWGHRFSGSECGAICINCDAPLECGVCKNCCSKDTGHAAVGTVCGVSTCICGTEVYRCGICTGCCSEGGHAAVGTVCGSKCICGAEVYRCGECCECIGCGKCGRCNGCTEEICSECVDCRPCLCCSCKIRTVYRLCDCWYGMICAVCISSGECNCDCAPPVGIGRTEYLAGGGNRSRTIYVNMEDHPAPENLWLVVIYGTLATNFSFLVKAETQVELFYQNNITFISVRLTEGVPFDIGGPGCKGYIYGTDRVDRVGVIPEVRPETGAVLKAPLAPSGLCGCPVEALSMCDCRHGIMCGVCIELSKKNICECKCVKPLEINTEKRAAPGTQSCTVTMGHTDQVTPEDLWIVVIYGTKTTNFTFVMKATDDLKLYYQNNVTSITVRLTDGIPNNIGGGDHNGFIFGSDRIVR